MLIIFYSLNDNNYVICPYIHKNFLGSRHFDESARRLQPVAGTGGLPVTGWRTVAGGPELVAYYFLLSRRLP